MTDQTSTQNNKHQKNNTDEQNKELATLGGGCFWCLEAVYQRMKGVVQVQSGYSGGHTENPSYEEVSTKTTGHAEVVQITFDPQALSYQDILRVFWQIHDPTTKNRQGNDVGPQYRSIILTHNDNQHHIAETSLEQDAQRIWQDPIVTEIQPFYKFYPAEDYHQDFYQNNPHQPYCQFVVVPKIKKFEQRFADLAKRMSK